MVTIIKTSNTNRREFSRDIFPRVIIWFLILVCIIDFFMFFVRPFSFLFFFILLRFLMPLLERYIWRLSQLIVLLNSYLFCILSLLCLRPFLLFWLISRFWFWFTLLLPLLLRTAIFIVFCRIFHLFYLLEFCFRIQASIFVFHCQHSCRLLFQLMINLSHVSLQLLWHKLYLLHVSTKLRWNFL